MRVARGLLLLWLLSRGSAPARDIHVHNLAGDDRFIGLQARNAANGTGPVRTITRALNLAQPGDRIVLAKTGRPYRESLSLVGRRHSGLPRRPFVIEGGGAILEGAAPVEPGFWKPGRGAVFRFLPPHGGHQQLFIDDLPAVRVPVGPSAAGPPKLQPREWCAYQGHLLFRVEPEKLPEDYNLSYAHLQTGITLFQVRHVAILNLTVQGFHLDGINAYNGAREVYLGGVRCRGNGRSGITVGGACSVEIDVSTIGNNGRAQLLTLPWSKTSVRNSDLFSNTAPAWVDRGGRVYLDGKRVEGGIDGRDVVAAEDAGN